MFSVYLLLNVKTISLENGMSIKTLPQLRINVSLYVNEVRICLGCFLDVGGFVLDVLVKLHPWK